MSFSLFKAHYLFCRKNTKYFFYYKKIVYYIDYFHA